MNIVTNFQRLNSWMSASVHRGFFRDIGVVSVLRLSGGVLLFVSQILLARWMDTESFGIYSFAWTWVAVLGAIAGLGLASTSVRFLASYRTLGDHDHMRGLVRHSWRATLAASFLVVLIAWPAFELALAGTPYLPALRIALLAVPVMAVLNIDAAFARGMQWMGIAPMAEQIGRPLILVVLGFLLVEVGERDSAVAFVGACFLAYLAVTVIQHVVIHRRLSQAIGGGNTRTDLATWRQVSKIQLFLNGALMLRMNGDPILVGALLGPSDVGIYIAAVRTATLVSFVLMITGVVAQPNLSAIHARKDRDALVHFFAIARRWTFLASLAAACVLSLGGSFILGLFGDDYKAALPALLILLAGHVVAAAFGPVNSMLVMADRKYSAIAVLGTATLLNAILTIVLTHSFGIAGAAAASSLSLIFAQASLFFVLRRQLL